MHGAQKILLLSKCIGTAPAYINIIEDLISGYMPNTRSKIALGMPLRKSLFFTTKNVINIKRC